MLERKRLFYHTVREGGGMESVECPSQRVLSKERRLREGR